MDSATAWSLILGVISPVIISIINRPTWTNQQKRMVAIGFAVLIGVINLIIQGALNDLTISFNAILINLALVISAAQVVFTTVWKPSGLADVVEVKTSGTSFPVDPPATQGTTAPPSDQISHPSTTPSDPASSAATPPIVTPPDGP